MFWCKLLICAVLGVFFCERTLGCDTGVQVNISENMSLCGYNTTNRKNGLFYGFKGIPYAKPPLGNLRFKPPQPFEDWIGERKAQQHGNECRQYKEFEDVMSGSEDCLFLNVYTPEISSNSTNKPVMFWIHGGSFTSSSGNDYKYGPQYLLTQDIVLVTFNYRLSVFGFLQIKDPSLEVYGNMGLKDMLLALKWVKKNIIHFNGDPDNITIFGESAGSISVHLFILSHITGGLFHKAIAQSGLATNMWAIAPMSAENIAKALGHNEIKTENEAFKIINSTSPDAVIKAQQKLGIIGPVVEEKSTEAFLTQLPKTILESGEFNDVPLMTGFTDAEGMFLLGNLSTINSTLEYVEKVENLQMFIPRDMKAQPNSKKSLEIAKKLKEYYFSNSTSDKIFGFINLATDAFFLKDIDNGVRLHASKSKSGVYYYRFAFDLSINYWKNLAHYNLKRACHADDLGYLFESSVSPKITQGSLEDKAIDMIVELWTEFAKYDDPIPTNSYYNFTWLPILRDKYGFLNLNDEPDGSLKELPEQDRLDFWKELHKFADEFTNSSKVNKSCIVFIFIEMFLVKFLF